jgi:hypothetical protein
MRPHLHPRGSHPVFGWATQADAPSTRCAVRLTGEMKGHVLNTAHATFVTVGVTIENSAALASRGQGPRRLGATCATCVSLSVFELPIMSSSMTVKPTLVFGWRIIVSHVGQARQRMISSSSSSSPFT